MNLNKEQSDIIARQLMCNIMYDNGMVNRWNPERYCKKWIDKISPIAASFFGKNPEILTDDHLDQICSGEHSERQQLYGNLGGYNELDEILDDYFENH